MFVSALSNLLKFDFVFLFFRLKEVIYSQEQLYLVFEYVEFDLKKYMRTRGNEPLPREQAQSFTYQILQALIYLH